MNGLGALPCVRVPEPTATVENSRQLLTVGDTYDRHNRHAANCVDAHGVMAGSCTGRRMSAHRSHASWVVAAPRPHRARTVLAAPTTGSRSGSLSQLLVPPEATLRGSRSGLQRIATVTAVDRIRVEDDGAEFDSPQRRPSPRCTSDPGTRGTSGGLSRLTALSSRRVSARTTSWTARRSQMTANAQLPAPPSRGICQPSA